MLTIKCETDIRRCQDLWEQNISPEYLTDLWDVRQCFQNHFNRKPHFIIAEEEGNIVGFIPLCFIPEEEYYAYFPGEIWHGKTWLEQNRVVARDKEALNAMLKWMDDKGWLYYLRYLSGIDESTDGLVREDEIGYLFHPPSVGFSLDEYYAQFGSKTKKKITKEVSKLYDRGLAIRPGEKSDFVSMVSLNIDRFGCDSYFSDNRFAKSFRALVNLLDAQGWLRMTVCSFGEEVAAVDLGCLYNGTYTLLAGGTHAEYPGIAKAINLYHIGEGCRNKYNEIDFLCGDFSWKTMFHLSPRPLYEISNMHE